MKIALLISGYLRSFDENINKIKANIIQNFDCDIYIHITENHEEKYINRKITLDYIKNELNPKIIIFSQNFIFSQKKQDNNIINQNYKFYWLNEERKKICTIENIEYDLVVKIRPDLNINDKLNFDKYEENYVYIPIDSKIDVKKLKNKDDKYICDILAYGSPIIMNDYFDYYKKIKEMITIHGAVNETLLYNYLNEKSISYILIDINYSIILSLCNTIAITGDSGSGKTTISNILKDIFSDSFLLECDRYHKWERGNKEWNNYTHLNPDANYITKMTNDVFDLKIGNKIYQVDYDHETGKFTDKKIIEGRDNIIICGLHSLYIPEGIINLKIYMDTDENLRIPWKIKRDVQKRGYTIEKIIDQIKTRVEDFKKYIYPQKEKADIIINFYTNKNFNVLDYNIDEDLEVFLKIGVDKKYSIDKKITHLPIRKLEIDERFLYIYFEKCRIFNDYENIIKTIIINIY